MSKITLTDLVNLQNETTAVNAINSNSSVLEDAMDNTLWRTGSTPNQMEVNLDMNSNRIINLPEATTDFEPVRVQEFNRALFDATSVVLSYGLSNSLILDSRAAAQATAIPLGISYIIISKYGSSYPRCDAPYVRGGTVLPLIDGSGHQWGLDLTSGAAHAYWFGVKADGVTDDTFACQTAVNNTAGCTLYIKGSVGLSSRVNLVTGSKLEGVGYDSGFIALGTNAFRNGMLYVANASSIKINNLKFVGNLVEPTAYASGAIRIELNSSASSDMEDINITNNSFRAFKTSEWIGVFLEPNITNTHRFIGFNVSNNYANAVIGCATTAGTSGNTFLQIFANTATTSYTQGDVCNVVFHNNKILGLGLSGALACFGVVHNVSVSGNTTLNMGNNTLATDRQYTYLFYNSDPLRLNPYDISIVNNVGYGNHNNAVYFAGVMNSVISGNNFRFTYPGGVEPTLPWGPAIALNATRNVTVTGNTLTDGLGGIALVSASQPVRFAAGDTADTHTISNNSIYNSSSVASPQAPYGILVSGVTSDTTDSLINISGNTIKVIPVQASTGISIVGVYVGNLKISNNLIETNNIGIGTSGTINPAKIELINNRVFGTLTTYAIDVNLNSGVLFFTNNLADFSNVVAGSSGGVRLSGPEVYINGLTIYNKTNSGNAVTLDTITYGTLQNVSFPQTTSTYIGSGLGYAAPTSASKAGDFVQNIGTISELGSGGSKYLLSGWTCTGGTTWLQNRVLTGN